MRGRGNMWACAWGYVAWICFVGMPRDAAVVVSQASHVEINNCLFAQLGGGGVHVTNASSDVLVTSSTFTHLGQSGVMVSLCNSVYGL